MTPHKRNQAKITNILKKRGYKDGKAPKGYDVHHVKPVKEGGKETSSNIRIIKHSKHVKIHKNRRKVGKI